MVQIDISQWAVPRLLLWMEQPLCSGCIQDVKDRLEAGDDGVLRSLLPPPPFGLRWTSRWTSRRTSPVPGFGGDFRTVISISVRLGAFWGPGRGRGTVAESTPLRPLGYGGLAPLLVLLGGFGL